MSGEILCSSQKVGDLGKVCVEGEGGVVRDGGQEIGGDGNVCGGDIGGHWD